MEFRPTSSTDSVSFNAQSFSDGSLRFSATIPPRSVPCLTRLVPEFERAHDEYAGCLADARQSGGIESLLKSHLCTTRFLAESYTAENAAHGCLLGSSPVGNRFL